MPSKRNKPALIELIDKGNLTTPGWFYGKKKTRLQQLRKEANITAPKPQELMDRYRQPHDQTQPPPADHDAQPIPAPAPAAKPYGAAYKDKKLTLWLCTPWWVPALAGLGLILVLLLVFNWGQSSGRKHALAGLSLTGTSNASDSPGDNNFKDSPPPEGLNQARSNPPRPGLIANQNRPGGNLPSVRPNNPALGDGNKPAPPGPGNAGQTAPQEPRPVIKTGQYLIMCGSSKKEVLEPVQQYFAERNLPTAIRRYGGRYVLVPAQPVPSSQARTYINQAARIGADYEINKPPGAPGFAVAWKTMFWVGLDKIKD